MHKTLFVSDVSARKMKTVTSLPETISFLEIPFTIPLESILRT